MKGIEGEGATELFKLVLSAGTRGYELEAEEISGRAGAEQGDEASSSFARSQQIVSLTRKVVTGGCEDNITMQRITWYGGTGLGTDLLVSPVR